MAHDQNKKVELLSSFILRILFISVYLSPSLFDYSDPIEPLSGIWFDFINDEGTVYDEGHAPAASSERFRSV